jgi:hypothetical protein
VRGGDGAYGGRGLLHLRRVVHEESYYNTQTVVFQSSEISAKWHYMERDELGGLQRLRS